MLSDKKYLRSKLVCLLLVSYIFNIFFYKLEQSHSVKLLKANELNHKGLSCLTDKIPWPLSKLFFGPSNIFPDEIISKHSKKRSVFSRRVEFNKSEGFPKQAISTFLSNSDSSLSLFANCYLFLKSLNMNFS